MFSTANIGFRYNPAGPPGNLGHSGKRKVATHKAVVLQNLDLGGLTEVGKRDMWGPSEQSIDVRLHEKI